MSPNGGRDEEMLSENMSPYEIISYNFEATFQNKFDNKADIFTSEEMFHYKTRERGVMERNETECYKCKV